MTDNKSWAPQVQTDNTGNWYGNALRFGTRQEAEDNARDLAARWFAVSAWRAIETDDPVNYTYIAGHLIALEPMIPNL